LQDLERYKERKEEDITEGTDRKNKESKEIMKQRGK
jgi:hypothetical protein